MAVFSRKDTVGAGAMRSTFISAVIISKKAQPMAAP